MGVLHLTLFGGFEARAGTGTPVDISAKKARGLLAYLALQDGRPQSRDKLADLLWSERDDAHGHNSLRQALTGLRKALDGVDPTPLLASRETVALEPDAVEVDALAFEHLLCSATPANLERATDLYRGDLLEGIGIQDPVFEDWLRDEQARFRDLATRALTDQLDLLSGSGNWQGAIRAARRLLELDPLEESVHRSLMRCHAESGDCSAALRQYQACRAILDRDLGVRPELETEQLYQAIRQGRESLTGTVETVDTAATTGKIEVPLRSEKPSIAVMPFISRGGGPEPEGVRDSLTENVVTGLLRFPDLKVVAWGLPMFGEDQGLTAADLARDHGVRYVLGGSIQNGDKHIRVSAQLIDTTSNAYVWSDRYDRDLDNTFAALDEIAGQIAATLGGMWGVLYKAEFERIDRAAPTNADPFAFYVRGLEHARKYTKDGNGRSRQNFERAIRLEPSFSSAFAELARAHYFDYWYEWVDEPHASLASAETIARKAVSLNLKDPQARLALGMVYFAQRRNEQAIAELEAGLTQNPNFALLKGQLGEVLAATCRADHAIALIEDAIHQDPVNPRHYLGSLGYAHFVSRDYQMSIEALSKRSLEIDSPTTHLFLAASYAQLDRLSEAESEIAHVLEIWPSMTVKRCVEKEPYVNPEDSEHLRRALLKAGLPPG